MRVLIGSDQHLEWHEATPADRKDLRGKEWAETTNLSDVDVFANAGDLCGVLQLETIIPILCDRVPNLVFTAGNHEFYGKPRNEVLDILQRLADTIPNFHWLENSTVELDGVTFAGTTLWFAGPNNPMWKLNVPDSLHDIAKIPDFLDWVFDANSTAVDFLVGNIADVVMTHHAPSELCLSDAYHGDPANQFFFTEALTRPDMPLPRLWVHGHVHYNVDTFFEDTRIVANPAGYTFKQNEGFDDRMIIDV